MTVEALCKAAAAHAPAIALAPPRAMNAMLQAAAGALRANLLYLIDENARDVEACTRGPQAVERLRLSRERVERLARELEKLIALPTPVGEVLERYTAPNGMEISRVRVPLGVVGIFTESKPSVTAEAIGLCIKSGNAAVLCGAKDAVASNRAIVSVIKEAIGKMGIDPEFLQFVEETDGSAAARMMQMQDCLDVILPLGGALGREAVARSAVPILEMGRGNCHLYVESSASILAAANILMNAKTQRASAGNACESLVVDEIIAKSFLPFALGMLKEKGVEIRGDERTRQIFPEALPASARDFDTEYLAPILSVKVVRDINEAIAFINAHGTHHSDAIVTKNAAFAERFLNEIDSAVVYVNASTRLTDGYEFGFGTEIGVSTQKLHARGPLGLRELTTYKYQVRGSGQVRL